MTRSASRLAILLALASASQAVAQGYDETILRFGDPTPEGIGTIRFATIDFLADGSLVVDADLSASLAATAERTGWFRLTEGGLETIVRTGQTTPDGTATIDRIRDERFNASGQLAFRGNLIDAGGADVGLAVFRADPGSAGFQEIARSGDVTTAGPLFEPLVRGIDAAGRVAISTRLGADRGPMAIFTGTIADGEPLIEFGMIEGFRTPDDDGELVDTTNGIFGGLPGALAGDGTLFYRSEVIFDASPDVAEEVLYRKVGSDIVEMARTGMTAAASMQLPTRILTFVPDETTGGVIFAARAKPLPGTGGIDDDAFFHADDQGAVLVAREGDTLTTGESIDFSSSFGTYNRRGQVAFSANIEGTTQGTSPGIITADRSGIRELARFDADNLFAGERLTTLRVNELSETGLVVFEGRRIPVDGFDDLGDRILVTDGIDLVQVAVSGPSPELITSGAMNPVTGQVPYTFTNLSQPGLTEARIFTPDLRWRAEASGAFEENLNWTLGLAPSAVHDVTIDSTAGAIVTAGASDYQVRSLTVGGSGAGDTLAIANGRTFTAAQDFEIRSGGAITGAGMLVGSVANAGTLGGAMGVTGDVNNQGQIDVATGETFSISGALSHTGGMTIAAGGAVEVGGAFSGPSGFTGGGTLQLAGEVRPGASTASLAIGGDLTLQPTATSFIELGGIAAGQFDQFVISGDAALAGDLNVSLLDGFSLVDDQTFPIFDVGGTLTGQFDGLGEGDLIGLFNDTELFITYAGGDGNDVLLFSTPAPAGPVWIGGTGDWHEAANWSTGAIPTAGQIALIDNDEAAPSVVSVDRNPVGDQFVTEVGEVRIDAGESLRITPEVRFEVLSGVVQNDGLIVLETFTPGAGNTALRTEPNVSAPPLVIQGAGEVRLEGGQVSGQGLTIGPGQLVTGAGQLNASFNDTLRNEGIIHANVDDRQILIAGFGSTLDNTGGVLRASGGGLLRIDPLLVIGGTVEAIGAGSSVRAAANSVYQNVTFRTSTGGDIDFFSTGDATLTGAINEGAMRAQRINFENDFENSGSVTFGFADTSKPAAFNLLTDVTVTGGGLLDFRPGSFNPSLMTLGGAFAFVNVDNRLRGYGQFDPASLELGDAAVLEPNFVGSGAVKPTIVIDAPTRFNGAELRFDLRGARVDGAAPDPSQLNAGLTVGQTNDFDQVHVFDTLTLDGVVEFVVSLQDDFVPQEGDFFDILTADQIVLNGSLDFDFAAANGMTFEHEILSLLDPGAGMNRDVLRITFGLELVIGPGDYDQDGDVDTDDYQLWQDSYGATGADLAADGNGDGIVNAIDYAIWRENLGAGTGAASTPEPSAILLLMVMIAATCFRKRSHQLGPSVPLAPPNSVR